MERERNFHQEFGENLNTYLSLDPETNVRVWHRSVIDICYKVFRFFYSTFLDTQYKLQPRKL